MLLVSAWWRWQWLDLFSWDIDEGIYLMVARLVIAGYRPYDEVFFSQLPLFLEVVRLAFRWGGGVAAVRLVISAFALLEIAAAALLARELGGNLAGIAAAIFVSLSPELFYYSRAVMADIPSVAAGTWAAWMAWRYGQTGQRRRLAMSGVLLALSLLLKLLTLYIVGWVLLIVILYRWRASSANSSWFERTFRVGQDALLFGSSVLLPALGILVWYDLPSLFSSAVEMRLAMRSAFHANAFEQGLFYTARFWRNNVWLILLAAYGLGWQYRRRTVFWVMLAWLGLATMTLMIHVPLYGQHFQVLPPILAIPAGIGTADLLRSLGQNPVQPPLSGRLWSGLGIALLAGYLVTALNFPQRVPNSNFAQQQDPGQTDVLRLTQALTTPDDCIVTDDLGLAVQANRDVIPLQAELSVGRVKSGYLSETDFIQAMDRAQCQVVIFSSRQRFDELFPNFRAWVEAAYARHLAFGIQEMYIIRRNVTPPAAGEPLAGMGGLVQLVAARWDKSAWHPGQTIPLTFYWRATESSQAGYKVFLHLRNVDNQTVAQLDFQPYGGMLPIPDWPPNETLKEVVRFELPSDVPPGRYTLRLGLYDPVTLERLPVADDTSGENAVLLGQVDLEND
ncbi:MAG: glycosyltransferase family 39 protein [Anaerolineae bacterium]